MGLRSTSSSGVEMIIWVKRMPMLFPSALSDFSLLDALKEGYFSDLSVQSCDGKQVRREGSQWLATPLLLSPQASVHRTVLSAVCRSVRYRDWELFLSDLTSPAFQAALQYVVLHAVPIKWCLSSYYVAMYTLLLFLLTWLWMWPRRYSNTAKGTASSPTLRSCVLYLWRTTH